MNKKIKYIASYRLPIEWGIFTMHGFEEANGQKHIALSIGDFSDGLPVSLHIHSECSTDDVLFSQKCDCGPQLRTAIQAMQKGGRGIIVYLRQEGHGIGLINRIHAYRLQDQGLDTVKANPKLGLPVGARDFSLVEHICDRLDVHEIKLLINNPEEISTLQQAGTSIVKRVSLQIGENNESERYLYTKAKKLGYSLFSE